MDEIWINTRVFFFFSFLEMKTPRGVVKQPERSGPTVYWSVYKVTQLKSGCIYFSRSWRWLWMEHWKPLTLFFAYESRERERESPLVEKVSQLLKTKTFWNLKRLVLRCHKDRPVHKACVFRNTTHPLVYYGGDKTKKLPLKIPVCLWKTSARIFSSSSMKKKK